MPRTIRELRRARGITQQELAQQVEISGAQLSRIESLDSGPSDGVLVRLCQALECEPRDVLVAPVRNPGGQRKVISLAVPPSRIARPKWTSACRLAGLRAAHSLFMRGIEPDIRRCQWFLDEAPSESADETKLQLVEIAAKAEPAWQSTAGLGFDLWPVCDEEGRGAATCLRPALVTPHYTMLFQVSVSVGGRRPRMDCLVLVLAPRPTFLNIEVDGSGHRGDEDERRTRALGMVTLRIPGSDLLKGPTLTERLRAIGFCLPR